MSTQIALFDVNIDNVFNQFLAVGAATRSTYSLDGETWTAVTLTALPLMTDLCFGQGVAVAIGQTVNTSNIIYSCINPTALANWTTRTSAATGIANIGWQAIAFGNNKFVAVGGGIDTTIRTTSTVTITSPDSATWTLNSSALTAADWRCIAYGESKFVTLSYGSNLARYSSDGVTWSNGSGLPIGKWKSVCYDSTLSRFVAVSIMPVKVYAANATTIAFTSATKRLTRVAGNFTTDTYFVGGTIVISGTASNNGTFTIAAVSTTTMDVNEAIVDEAANASAVVTPIKGSAYSDDGITWTAGSPSTYLEPSNWVSVSSDDAGHLVAISSTANNDIAAYSTDGINWTRTLLPVKVAWAAVSYGHGRFLAISGATGYVAWSTDNGATWVLGPIIGAFAWTVVRWCPFPFHTNDTLTIDRGATVTVNTDQHAAWSAMTITNGTLRIENTSTSSAIRFVTARVTGAAAQAITPSSGLGSIEVEGNWIEIGTGDGSDNQAMTVPYTDYVPCLWVETGVGTGEYEIWLNVSVAYGGTLRQYTDGLLDVSTGQRGKFFKQTPNSAQDKFITATATITLGSFTVTLDSTAGIYQGAAIIGVGIPNSTTLTTNTLIEQVVDATTVKINALPTASATGVPVRIINPYSSQFTNEVVFGDDVNGNTLTSGVKVRIPNIMITSDTPANIHTASAIVGCSFVMTSGGRLSMDTCLFDEAYHNLNQTQSLTINNVGMHLRPTITEVYDLNISSFGLGMPAVRRYNTGNIWLGRDIRDTQVNSLLMNYITGAVIDDLVMVLQSPNAITAATVTAPTGMLNLANSDAITVSNVRMYSLNTVKAFQCGLAFSGAVTNSTFTNIENYGSPMLSLQNSSNNTFTNLIQSETMFACSHNYTAGTRVTYDPSTGVDMVEGTKYYFKSRTFFSRDRNDYVDSRSYGITPFKGSTYFPDYITAYCNGPQSVLFAWTHRTPMYTAATSPATNANAKNFIEIYRDTSANFTPTLSKKVAGLNTSPSICIPTVVTWATENRTLAFSGLSVTRTVTFDQSDKTIVASTGDFTSDGFAIGDKVIITGTASNNGTFTITNVVALTITVSETSLVDEVGVSATIKTNKITASSGSFITDGYSVGDNLRIMGTATSSNNGDFTISTVAATVMNVTETLTTQSATGQFVYMVGKYVPTLKFRHIAGAGSRNLTFSGLSITNGAGRVWTFAAAGKTITSSGTPGNFSTDGFLVGDKVQISGSASNDTTVYFLTITTLTTTVMTFAGDTLTDEVANSGVTIKCNKVTASSGSFITDGVVAGDIVEVSGSANAGNNKVFTVAGLAATTISFIETAATQAVESSGATLNVKNLPVPKVIWTNASKSLQLTFMHPVATASASRIFTFDSVQKTITATGASPGSFITDGFVVGDKVVVTGTTYNNKVTLTLTTVTATVLTISAITERQYDEVSTTAVLTADHLTRSVGSWITDGYTIGDTITISGSTSGTNDGTFFVNNVTALYMSVVTGFTTQSVNTSGVTITATKLLPKQQIYFTPARTFATNQSTRVITGSSGNFLQDGYIVGDKFLLNGVINQTAGTNNVNMIYTATAVASTTITVAETLGSANIAATGTNIVTWTHTGQRPVITTTAATLTLTWTAATKTLTMGTSTSNTFDTFNVVAGDKILVTGQFRNNGLFTVATHPTAATITVTEPVTVDTTTYINNNGQASLPSTVYVFHPTQKATVTAAGGRTLTFDPVTKSVTASSGSFIVDGYYVGDCVQIAGSTGGINDGYFTIAALSATIMTFNELIYSSGAANTLVESATTTISAPNILNDTDYYYILRKYDSDGVYHDSEDMHIRTTVPEINTNLCLKGTAFTTTEWTSSGITVGAATRISPYISPTATQTADAIIITSTTADASTLTQTIPTAINNNYTFSLWVCTQPTVIKVAVLTAAPGRTLKFDSKNITRTVTFNNAAKTIVAGSGDFTTDFAIGDKITITGTASNNRTVTVATVVALTITVSETSLVDEAGISATIKCQKITASTGSFLTDGYETGDHILITGATTATNNGWFTISNVVATILNLSETVTTEVAYSATLTITDYYNDTLSVDGSIKFGTATQTFTATAQWQRVSVTFTATATTHDAVITITTKRRSLCIFGATVNQGTTAKPYLTTTTATVSNAVLANPTGNRDLNLVRAWCRGLGEPDHHSGIHVELAAALTGELWTEVCVGTSNGFTPTYANRVFDTWAATGYTMIFNQISQYNVVDNFDDAGPAAPINYALAYFAATSLGNKIKNVTFDFGGAMMAVAGGLASFNTQSNDTYFYNWNIKNWRNYATLPASTNPMLFGGVGAGGSNATSGLRVENLICDNSDFPIQNLMLGAIMKGVSGGNVKPLNAAQFYSMPITPVYVLGGGATNYDSLATSTPTVYTTEYDTIFNELYFTETTGALSIVFNASALEDKPYVLSGSASFSNSGRLYLIAAGDSIEYTWPHTILGVSGFRDLPLLLNGVDLGNTPSLLEGLLVEYKIDTGSGYPGSWTTATGTNLSAETVSATDGFNLKIKITAKLGMKYAPAASTTPWLVKDFVLNETIRGASSGATATVSNIFKLTNYGTIWLTSVTGTFATGETIVRDSDGELRALNVATNTVFATFPSATSYIDGLQIYTTVDQTALYPPERQTLSLTGLKANSEVRIYSAGTTTELAGIENSTDTFDYEYVYSAGTYVDIVILHLDWDYYRIDNYLLPSTGASLPITQITDRVYSN